MLQKYALFKVFAALRNSTTKESVHSAAKKAKVSVSAAKYSLDYLYANDMVTREVYGRMYQYGLNLDNAVVRQLKVTFSLQEIHESGIVDEIRSNVPNVLFVSLFGSVATGNDTPKSDIDIIGISRAKHHMKGFNAEKKLDREVSWHWYTLSEWKKVAAEDKPFYESVVFYGIPLIGEKPVVK